MQEKLDRLGALLTTAFTGYNMWVPYIASKGCYSHSCCLCKTTYEVHCLILVYLTWSVVSMNQHSSLMHGMCTTRLQMNLNSHYDIKNWMSLRFEMGIYMTVS
jgi:hypothetical protein